MGKEYSITLSNEVIARYAQDGYLMLSYRLPDDAFIVRIMPGNCHYDHALSEEIGVKYQAHDYDRHPLFLIRGQDRTCENSFTIGH